VTRTWFTADLHLGHDRIRDLAKRPFGSVEEMNEVIIERFNAVVGVNDTVWMLGDVAMGQIRETLPMLGRLKGHKYLVAGNHDKCFAGAQPDAKLRARWVDAYCEQGGFRGVVTGSGWLNRPACGNGIPLLLPRVGGDYGPTVQLSHFPYAAKTRDGGDRYAASRPKPWRPGPKEPYPWLLCGHVHGAWAVEGDMINVGVDVWDFRPVEDEVVRALIEGGPQ
jgi:calcineurin-like phosphoesterase family protein